jgi:2-keto-4-pentenoate hydratase
MDDKRTLSNAAVLRAGKLLWQCWDKHSQVEALPEPCQPQNTEDGYAIQNALIKAAGHTAVGWKIGATNRAAQEMLALDGPVSGRLFEPFCYDSPAEIPSTDFAMRALEPEIAFRLNKDLPARNEAYTATEMKAAIAAAYPALEIPDTRLVHWNTLGAPSFVADNSVAGRFVLGAEQPDWQRFDLSAIPAKLIIDGEEAATGSSADVLGSPLNALAWLANHLPSRGASLKAGDLVTTGTCSPIRFAEPGAEVIADFGDFGSATVRFTTA